MCKCFKCKKDFPATELTWEKIANTVRLICDECRKEKKL